MRRSAFLAPLSLAFVLAQQPDPRYKFSTTVNGEPLCKFGTTVVAMASMGSWKKRAT